MSHIKEMSNEELCKELKEKAIVCDALFCSLLLEEAIHRIERLDRLEKGIGNIMEKMTNGDA